jgi:hypothetical protein
MPGSRGSPAPPPPVWYVGGCAAASAFIGSVFCWVVATAVNTQGAIGAMGLGPPRGLNVVLVAMLFGVPITGFIGAALAYWIVMTQRRTGLGVLAVLGGVFSGILLGSEVAGIASWWVSAVTLGGDWGWAEVTTVLTVAFAATIGLSGRVALEYAPTTRRGRLVSLLALGAIVGLVIGMLVGGLIGFFSSFESPCPPAYFGGGGGGGPGGVCIGPGAGPGLAGGMLLGSWLGGLEGMGTSIVLWAVPPPVRPGAAEEVMPEHATEDRNDSAD